MNPLRTFATAAAITILTVSAKGQDNAPHANPITEQNNVATTQEVAAKVKWQDVIKLDIPDPDLNKRVERFLNYLQNARFKYQKKNPVTGKTTIQAITGQDILKKIAERKGTYLATGLTGTLRNIFGKNSIGPNGEFVIAQHDKKYDGTAATGCHTTFVTMPGGEPLPTTIKIGRDYLRGAQYYDAKNVLHPTSVEAVIANELGHLVTGEIHGNASIDYENFICTTLGAAPRVGENVEFTHNTNNGYVSLLPEMSKSSPKPPNIDIPEKTGPQ